MQVDVRLLTGERFSANLAPEQTIADLKRTLAKKKQSLKGCRLLFGGKVLDNKCSIGSLPLCPGSFLTGLECRSRPGSGRPSKRKRQEFEEREIKGHHESSGIKGLDSLLPGYALRPNASPHKIRKSKEGEDSNVPIDMSLLHWTDQGRLKGGQDPSDRPFMTSECTMLCVQQCWHDIPAEKKMSVDSGGTLEALSIKLVGNERPSAGRSASKKVLQHSRRNQSINTSYWTNGEKQKALEAMPEIIPPEAVASLPLPHCLHQLQRRFLRLSLVMDFLTRTMVRTTWKNIQGLFKSLGFQPSDCMSLEDLELLSLLCPEVIGVRKTATEEDSLWGRNISIQKLLKGFDDYLEVDPGDVNVTLMDPLSARGKVHMSFVKDATQLFVQQGYLSEAVEGCSNTDPALLHLKEHDQTSLVGQQDDREQIKKCAGNGKENKRIRQLWTIKRSMIEILVALQCNYVSCYCEKGGGEKRRIEEGALTFPQSRACQLRRRTSSIRGDAVPRGAASSHEPNEEFTDEYLTELLKQGRFHPDFSWSQISLKEFKSAALEQKSTQRCYNPQDERTDHGREEHAKALHKNFSTTYVSCSAPPRPLHRFPSCFSSSKIEAAELLEHLRSLPNYCGQCVHVEPSFLALRMPAEYIPGRSASLSGLGDLFGNDWRMASLLAALGIEKLYQHQMEAIKAIRSSHHTVITTPTASGKSLCYVLPIIESLLKDPSSTALLCFPTKALAQDQLRSFRKALSVALGPSFSHLVDVYDGDVAMEARPEIRNKVQILITNPDMLHVSILPCHKSFHRFLSNIKYCVVDEAHMYKGTFGVHAALVFRRLRRICERIHFQSPTFILPSATLYNPAQHASNLVGADAAEIEVINNDGSPSAPRHFALWNPPRLGNGIEGVSPSSNASKSFLERRRKARIARQERQSGVKLGNGTSYQDWIDSIERGSRSTAAAVRSRLREIDPLHLQKGYGVAEVSTCRASHSEREEVKGIEPEQHAMDEESTSMHVILKESNSRRHACYGNVVEAASWHPRSAAKEYMDAPDDLDGTLEKNFNPLNEIDGISSEALCRENSRLFDALKHSSDTGSNYSTVDSETYQRRSSPIVEIASLLAECIQHQLRTIAFCKSRKLCELVVAYTREILSAKFRDKLSYASSATKIAVYRSGYSPEERRSIEQALFAGDLLAVAATNALELGIDVGDIEVTLHLGFPGSMASLKQQSGRAGRREKTALSIYVAWDSPLDQYFFADPKRFFSRPMESAIFDPSNVMALRSHLPCAASEVPLELSDPSEMKYFGPKAFDVCSWLVENGVLGRLGGSPSNLQYTGTSANPASVVSLRSIDANRFTVLDERLNGKVLEEVEESKAFYSIYDGAVYMYQGRTYLVKKLDLHSRIAVVHRSDVKYFTRPVDFTTVTVVGGKNTFLSPNALGASELMGPERSFNDAKSSCIQEDASLKKTAICAPARVTKHFKSYNRIQRGTGLIIDTVDLHLPDVEYETVATFVRLPPTARRRVESLGLPFRAGVHAASHALLNVLPLMCLSDTLDVATECDHPNDTRYRPERILIYDKHAGGIGISAAAQPVFIDLLKRSFALVSSCECSLEAGCPACVQHTECGEYNAVLNKKAALIIFEAVLEEQIR